ncbi:quaternary ammonium compound-resistance protein SugE [Spirosoma endophyticum]|uniref:Quaternary ammonium compound-resistance protein SugE n=2 Tax=Spirosoma endophyticum TaxID=662367 RepID=A0A1I1WRP6_9BACT|nr:quaternary ammonium compound-resistance protein SugE [Spirosoma endophyticum]
MLSWLYLIGAAACQTAWMYSLKYISLDGLKTLRWTTFYRLDGGLPALLPWLAYVVFGIVNTVLLASAMRTIPTTTAFAVWMASTLVFLKAADVLWLKMNWSWTEFFFIVLITIGIVGLKLAGPTE